MVKAYQYTRVRRVTNGLMERVLKLGFGPPGIWLLTVKGRKTGQSYETPVSLVEQDGTRYLVSPYGERSWVKNARAAGEVRVKRGRRDEMVGIEELAAAEAAPVLREYLRANGIVKSFFEARPDSPDEAFAAEAQRHPVFRLVER
jgi:deazaflavin-dependent oxidoreductase (nitroreductase family)